MALLDAALWSLVVFPRSPARASQRLITYCRAARHDVSRLPGRPVDTRDPGGWRFGGFYPWRFRGSDVRLFRRALPDALDTLAVCLRAGLGLNAAVAEYAKTASGVTGDAFRVYLAELAVGRQPDEALENLARRYPFDELTAAAAAVAQNFRIGTPLADVLEAQAVHCRALTIHRSREAAQKLSTQLVLPLVAFIFPVVFIIGLGPVAIKVARLVGWLR
jgi:tight adherence protein C